MNAERAAINAPIQGGAADIIKMAMRVINKKLTEQKLKTKMLLQVHDELIVECDTTDAELVSKIMKETMESVIKLDVPLKVSVESGTSWGQFH
jgi:DNA polymerase-1